MSCININHPEFKRLKSRIGGNPIGLAAEVGIWMQKHNSLEFPSVEEILFTRELSKINLKAIKPLDNKNLSETLNSKLQDWATTHGVSITSLDDFFNKIKTDTKQEKILGAVDILNKLIGINFENQIDSTLAEEISHIATSILKEDASVKRAMDNIEDTDFYKQIEEEYKDTYADKESIKKEAVDKLLARAIQENFQEKQNAKGVLPYLKAIFEKFTKWVNNVLKGKSSVDTIKKDLYPIAKKILSNEYLGEVDSKTVVEPVLFQKKESEEKPKKKSEKEIAKEFLQSNISSLRNRLARLMSLDSTKETLVTDIETQIKLLEKQIKNEELRAGVLGVITMAEKELKQIRSFVDKQQESGETDGNKIHATRQFIDSYFSLFKNFKEQMSYYGFHPKLRAQMEESMANVLKELHDLDTSNAVLNKKHSIKVAKKTNTNSAGEKIDESFDEEKVINDIGDDTTTWRVLIGNFKQAKSAILRSAFKLVQSSNLKIKRNTVDVAERLQLAQTMMEKDGYKPSDLVDKLVNDKGEKTIATQFLVRKENWGEHIKARDKMREDLVKALGYNSWEEVYSLMINEKLTEEEQNLYTEATARFKENHPTVPIYDEYGQIIGRKPKALNPDYERLMKVTSVKNYYDLLLTIKEESLKKLPKKYRTDIYKYALPGVRAQFVEKLFRADVPLSENIRQIWKESVFRDSQDTEFGEVDELGNQMVPIYFNYFFENSQEVSVDLTRSFTIFYEMSENYLEKNKIAGDIWSYLKQIEGKKYTKRMRGETLFEGAATNEYKAMRMLLEQHVYGVTDLDVVSSKIPENAFTKKIGIANKQFSWSKFTNKLTRFIRNNNLALSPFTSIAGAAKGAIDSIMEDQIGRHSTVESKNWARKEYFKNLPEVLKQSVYKKQTNKMHLLMRRMNIVDLNTILKNTERSKIVSNLASSDNLYINYKVADYAIKGRVMLSIYDNNRLVGDKFIDKETFLSQKRKEGVEEKEINKEWATYRDKSYYNAFEVSSKGEVVVKKEFADFIDDITENRIMSAIEDVSNNVDGVMSPEDKGTLSRQILGEFVLMHRGWLINMLDSRFMARNVNLLTEKENMGYYQAVGEFISKDMYGEHGILSMYKALSATNWKKMRIEDPAKAKGLKRAFLDLIYLNVVGFLAALTNIAADDDDDNFALQFAAFQMNRILLEQASGNPILKSGELISIIEKPVVGANTIKELLELTQAFNFSDINERGMYKDKSKATRWWIRKTPFKSLYESQYPEEKNKFMKQVLGSPIYNMMKNDDEYSVSYVDRLKNLFTYDPSISPEQAFRINDELE